MAENLLLTYCNYHPGFMSELEKLSEKRAILNKLGNEKNKIQFLSTISEFYFGLFFQQLGFSVVHEKKYSGKTPDWTLSYEGYTAIVDVYRLNSSEHSKELSYFQSKLFDEIQALNHSLEIKITFNENLTNLLEFKISEIVELLNEWLGQENHKVGNKITVLEFFTFEIIRTKSPFEYISCVGNVSSLDYKPQKLNQYEWLRNDNEITKKISKYNDIIVVNKLPYFIAVDIDFLSGFEYYEFVGYFRGKGVFFDDYGMDYKNFEGVDEIKYLGQEWTELGLFYENINLSGLFLRYNNEVKLLLNPSKKQIIYDNDGLLEFFKNIEKL